MHCEAQAQRRGASREGARVDQSARGAVLGGPKLAKARGAAVAEIIMNRLAAGIDDPVF